MACVPFKIIVLGVGLLALLALSKRVYTPAQSSSQPPKQETPVLPLPQAPQVAPVVYQSAPQALRELKSEFQQAQDAKNVVKLSAVCEQLVKMRETWSVDPESREALLLARDGFTFCGEPGYAANALFLYADDVERDLKHSLALKKSADPEKDARTVQAAVSKILFDAAEALRVKTEHLQAVLIYQEIGRRFPRTEHSIRADVETAFVLEKQKDSGRAEQHFERAVNTATEPSRYSRMAVMHLACLKEGRKDIVAASALWQKYYALAESDSDRAYALYSRGMLFHRAGSLYAAQAIQCFNQLVDEFHSDAYAESAKARLQELRSQVARSVSN